MNRPITSPCSAVLTSSPTITLMPVGLGARPRARRRSRCARSPRSPRGPCARASASSTSTGRRAVIGVVGVHVQVDVDQRPVRDQRAGEVGGGRRIGVAPRDERRRRPPRARRPPASSSAVSRQPLPAPRSAPQHPGVVEQPAQLAASVCASPGSNCRPRSPSAEQLLVDRKPAGDRHAPAPSARTSTPGVGATAVGAEHDHVGVSEQLLGVGLLDERKRTRARSRPGAGSMPTRPAR